MKFIIEEKQESGEHTYTVATSKSLPALMDTLKSEFLSYHEDDGMDHIEGWCRYDFWRPEIGSEYGGTVVSVCVYPMGPGVKLPLAALNKEWEKTTDVKYGHKKEARERAEYLRLHALYGKGAK